jgi:putative sterol carrier protein
MKMFSREWVEVFNEKLKSDDDFQEKGVGFDSKFQFVVEADPKAGVSENLSFGLNLPSCDEYWCEVRPESEVDIILQGKYGNLQSIMMCKTGLIVALATGKVKLKKGSQTKLVGYMGAVNRFLEVARGI